MTMKRTVRRIAASLALATAATTGALLADGLTTTQVGDTAWGASDTTGAEPADETTVPELADGGTVVVTPLDTAWG